MTPLPFETPVRGPSYSKTMRLVAGAALLLTVVFGLRSWEVIAVAGWASPAALMFVAAFLGMAGSYYTMLKSVTVIDAQGIRQTGLMERKVAWADVRKARCPRWGTNRLIVKAERGPFTVFFAGDATLRAAFARIAANYKR